ncbi:hypothetical protein U8527_09425 [Kordia algicida OT-1]|uniref:Uncharacterized protein n=1 Tax=Kordia algicida OT-1 TaxID=391587 RepID=A9DUR3_9FLAO|nr:hypothetical protein [Kordia algicida]EDP96323.1 hypothetical protein KAOT1_02902 [Kordia algicida OT-1]
MKKLLLLFVCSFAFFSCDDGDLTLEEIDLTSDATASACNLQSGVTLLFKINGSETLILEVPADLIINEATTEEEPRTEELNSSAFCYYRSFDTAITNAYFCDELPSDVPITLEYTAVAGTVEVITTEIIVGTTVESYSHSIVLRDVVFTGTNGQDVRYNEFIYENSLVTPVE